MSHFPWSAGSRSALLTVVAAGLVVAVLTSGCSLPPQGSSDDRLRLVESAQNYVSSNGIDEELGGTTSIDVVRRGRFTTFHVSGSGDNERILELVVDSVTGKVVGSGWLDESWSK